MLAAIAHPLTSLAPVVTASNYHDGWSYQGGAFEQWLNESGTSGLARDTLHRSVDRATIRRKWVEITCAHPNSWSVDYYSPLPSRRTQAVAITA
jgi:hypothetical protein